jgi:hypothetical protein
MCLWAYWFRCTIRSWNSLLSSNNPLLEKIVRADLLLQQKWYMDLPGSTCAPRFTYISTAFRCHTISSDYQSRTVWTHSTWTYQWVLERSWHFGTTWSSPFQQNYEDISHTFWCTFGEYFWMVGWQKKKSKACVASLPSLGHSQQPQPRTFLPSPFWPQLSGPKNVSWQE